MGGRGRRQWGGGGLDGPPWVLLLLHQLKCSAFTAISTAARPFGTRRGWDCWAAPRRTGREGALALAPACLACLPARLPGRGTGGCAFQRRPFNAARYTRGEGRDVRRGHFGVSRHTQGAPKAARAPCRSGVPHSACCCVPSWSCNAASPRARASKSRATQAKTASSANMPQYTHRARPKAPVARVPHSASAMVHPTAC